jgi:hypothetical protein
VRSAGIAGTARCANALHASDERTPAFGEPLVKIDIGNQNLNVWAPRSFKCCFEITDTTQEICRQKSLETSDPPAKVRESGPALRNQSCAASRRLPGNLASHCAPHPGVLRPARHHLARTEPAMQSAPHRKRAQSLRRIFGPVNTILTPFPPPSTHARIGSGMAQSADGS